MGPGDVARGAYGGENAGDAARGICVDTFRPAFKSVYGDCTYSSCRELDRWARKSAGRKLR